jgi:hypothetical protein
MSFALALMAVLGFGGLFIESAAAQNSNTKPSMDGNMRHGRRHARHWKHRRARRHNMNKRMTGNANH